MTYDIDIANGSIRKSEIRNGIWIMVSGQLGISLSNRVRHAVESIRSLQQGLCQVQDVLCDGICAQ